VHYIVFSLFQELILLIVDQELAEYLELISFLYFLFCIHKSCCKGILCLSSSGFEPHPQILQCWSLHENVEAVD